MNSIVRDSFLSRNVLDAFDAAFNKANSGDKVKMVLITALKYFGVAFFAPTMVERIHYEVWIFPVKHIKEAEMQ